MATAAHYRQVGFINAKWHRRSGLYIGKIHATRSCPEANEQEE